MLGPLAAVVGTDAKGTVLGTPEGKLPATANALLVMRRCVVAKPGEHASKPAKLDDTAVRAWAVETNLGQAGARLCTAGDLVGGVAERRFRALRALAGTSGEPGEGLACWAVQLRPDGPVLVGTSDRGVGDVGMTLHGTYGWPVLPGSGLKGAAHAYARDESDLVREDRERIFGTPRPDRNTDDADDTDNADADADAAEADADADEKATFTQGTVTFFDALPMKGDVKIREDVLTPHAKEYYIDGKPPAEYLQPVPVPFISAVGGEWVAYLVGPPADAECAADLLAEAAVTIGLGAKTSAGYGYVDEATARPRRMFASASGAGR